MRNCTKIPKIITEEIVGLIVNALLSKEKVDKLWNAGGTLNLSEIPKTVISLDLLKELKSECGGLQTLLRNHNHIFIVNKGMSKIGYEVSFENYKIKLVFDCKMSKI